ncbi:MAG: hypothetical protein Q9M36_05020 [Sulfurovum sp.]|nr:hypothetical protein [Sulfurovum sp.]
MKTFIKIFILSLFFVSTLQAFFPKAQISSENLLALSWQNAFCETHRYKKECKRDQK